MIVHYFCVSSHYDTGKKSVLQGVQARAYKRDKIYD
jgi:hypothetical protein